MIKNSIKKNTFIKCLFILLCAIVSATVLLFFLYSIPTERATNNVKQSLDLYSEEVIKTWSGNLRHGKLATSTDSNMIFSAICRPYKSNIDNALLNPQFDVSSSEEDPQRLSLTLAINNELNEYSNYGRYWHGYSIYMILGLFFFDLGELRTINMFIIFIATIVVLYELSKIDLIYSMLYTIVVLFLNPVTIIMNYALLSMYLIISLTMYIQLKYRNTLTCQRYIYLFLISGILTSFFDFLTYPLTSWGIPLATYLLINASDNKEINLVQVIKMSLAWVLGYAGMWVGKWIVASVLTEENIISDAANAILHRTTNNNVKISYISTLKKLFEAFDRPMLLLMLVGLVIVLITIAKNIKSFVLDKNVMYYCLMLLLISISPLFWFYIVRNHSYYHPWYEYRHIAIMLWACLLMLVIPFKRKL